MAKHIEVIVRGVAIDHGRVLACRNDDVGYFYLPGGHVEFGESTAAALQREFLEECGAEVRVGQLAIACEATFVSADKPHHEFSLAFHVELATSDRNVVSLEQGISFHWLDLAGLANFDLRPAAIKAWLMSGGVRDHVWVSDFVTKVKPSQHR